MDTPTQEWDQRHPEPDLEETETVTESVIAKIAAALPMLAIDHDYFDIQSKESPVLWLNEDLYSHHHTTNLDHQHPATIFFLGQVKDIEGVEEVFVEERSTGQRKHWVVLRERDYDAMDKIYEIEENTLSRFPAADLDFRVTLETEDGPTIRRGATKIYDAG